MSRAKVRPCKVGGCRYPAAKGRQFCSWHGLRRASSDVQAAAATQRRLAAKGPERARVPSAEWPEGERWCAGCQSFVPLFYTTGSRCKACASMAAHERRLEATYGIDGAEYERIFRAQGGRCAICRNRPASIRFAVDHDHQTGAVRGILCKRCNHDLLGGAHDSVDLLLRALAYLLFPPAQQGHLAVDENAIFVALKARRAAQERLEEARRVDLGPAPF